MPTDRGAEPTVFVVDDACLGQQGLGHGDRRGVIWQPVEHRNAPLDRPAKVDGRGPGRRQSLGLRQNVAAAAVEGHSVADGLAGSHDEPVAAGDADRRRTTHAKALDRLHDGVDVAAGDPLEPHGQERLIDEFEMAGGVALPAERDRDGGRWCHAVLAGLTMLGTSRREGRTRQQRQAARADRRIR